MPGAADFAIANEDSAILINKEVPAPKYIVAPVTMHPSHTQVRVWAWRALTHIRQVREVLKFLFRIPLFSEMLRSNPKFGFKFLTDDYLARGFSISEAASCYLHHYRRLHSLLPDQLLRQILQEEVTLHAIRDGSGHFALALGLSRPYDNEGELTLRLRVDGDIVYALSFTIVPGELAESKASEALLITRLQGIKGRYRQIGIATRALHQVAPDRLLLAALQGVADAFGVRAIVAVPAHRQTSYNDDAASAFRDAYDNLFSGLGFSRSATGFFSSAVPIDQKPLTSIKRGHRPRARKKRAFKHQIQLACARFFENSAMDREPESSN
jgi:uncharacterized protein VirK/YbjX